MMVVLDVFMEWYDAARGQTRTTETVVFVTSSWKMCRGRRINGKRWQKPRQKEMRQVTISSISTQRGSVRMCKH